MVCKPLRSGYIDTGDFLTGDFEKLIRKQRHSDVLTVRRTCINVNVQIFIHQLPVYSTHIEKTKSRAHGCDQDILKDHTVLPTNNKIEKERRLSTEPEFLET